MSKNFIRTFRDQRMRRSFLGLNDVREVMFGVYFGPFTNSFANEARRDTDFMHVCNRFLAKHRAVIHEKVLAQSQSQRRTVRDAEKPGVSIEKITVIRERDEKFGEMEESEDDEKAFEEVWRRRCGGSRVHV